MLNSFIYLSQKHSVFSRTIKMIDDLAETVGLVWRYRNWWCCTVKIIEITRKLNIVIQYISFLHFIPFEMLSLIISCHFIKIRETTNALKREKENNSFDRSLAIRMLWVCRTKIQDLTHVERIVCQPWRATSMISVAFYFFEIIFFSAKWKYKNERPNKRWKW